MARTEIEIGIVFSRTGSYAAVGEAMHAGALLALEEVNGDPTRSITLKPVTADPASETSRYVEAVRSFLARGIRHVVGCYTSSSRKEVLPLFDKCDALLWYPSHYEGFETNANVVYTGAAPNQHVIPLTRYLLDEGRSRAFLVGSNYIWAWENNRIMREALLSAGGAICGERYFPVGETHLDGVIEQIISARPDFIFNTLIGDSAYAFYRALRKATDAAGIDQPRQMPVASCSLAEPELARIGPEAADGHLSSSVYFSSVDTAENERFIAAWRRRFPALGLTSADAEASYIAVHLCAAALEEARTDAFDAVRAAVAGATFNAPQGRILVDPENRHCHMRPRIGRSAADGTFAIVHESEAPVRPDPYLVWETGMKAVAATGDRPRLRLVQ